MARSGTTPAQTKAIAALLAARSVTDAATNADVPLRTLRRWLAEDAQFKAALTAAEGELLDSTTRRLGSLSDAAIGLMVILMADKLVPPSVRLNAAKALMDYLIQFRNLRDVEQRLSALEAALLQGKGNDNSTPAPPDAAGN